MPRVKLFDETEVLNKALQLFWKSGYTATSIQDLVTHLGINRGSLYDTFGGKKKLFTTALEAYQKRNIESVRSFLAQYPSAKQGLKALFYNALPNGENNGCLMVNTTTELLPGDEDIKAVLEQNKAHFISLFHGFLKTAHDRNELHSGANLHEKATLLFTFFNGLKVVTKLEQNHDTLKTSIDVLIDSL